MTLGLTLWLIWLRLRWLAFVRPDASLKVKVAATVVILPLVAYPFMYGPVWWLRGLTGDLSITTICLLGLALYEQFSGVDFWQRHEQKLFYITILITGVTFYPLALGVGELDPYAWGYTSVLAFTLLGLALVLFWRKFLIVASIIVIAVVAWGFQFLQSVNLWDYCIDPFLVFYACWRVLGCKKW